MLVRSRRRRRQQNIGEDYRYNRHRALVICLQRQAATLRCASMVQTSCGVARVLLGWAGTKYVKTAQPAPAKAAGPSQTQPTSSRLAYPEKAPPSPHLHQRGSLACSPFPDVAQLFPLAWG